jgi:hypothetical protein
MQNHQLAILIQITTTLKHFLNSVTCPLEIYMLALGHFSFVFYKNLVD